MNNANTPQEQIAQLSKRLKQVVQSRKQLEDQYNTDFKTFSDLTIQLTHACSGLDVALDQKLAKLRGLLQRNSSMEIIGQVITDTEELIQRHSVSVQRQLKSTSEQATATIDQLKRESLSKPLAKQLATIEEQANHSEVSLNHCLDILSQLVSFYSARHVAQQSDNSNDDSLDESVQQLLKLLDKVEFEGATGQLVQNIKVQLKRSPSSRQFISLLLQLMQQFVKNINDERQSAQDFLLELNQTLGIVQGAIKQSLEARAEFDKQNGALNQQLHTNMQQLNDSVAAATRLAELKEQVSSHMQLINQALQQKSSLEQDERRSFEANLERVNGRVKQLERQVELYKRQLAEQKFKSLQDTLTKLPNRAAFDERLNVEYERWKRYKEPLCIAVADIDHFKLINDKFGHIAGDKTLQVLASMLRKSMQTGDFVCRYGGEEFVIIFPQSALTEVRNRVEQAREKIGNIPFKFKNDDIRITISIGIAEFNQDSDTVVTVFEAADKALYEAKRRGRDQVVVAEQE